MTPVTSVPKDGKDIEPAGEEDFVSKCFYMSLHAVLYFVSLIFGRSPELFLIVVGAASEYLIVDTVLEGYPVAQLLNIGLVFVATLAALGVLIAKTNEETGDRIIRGLEWAFPEARET